METGTFGMAEPGDCRLVLRRMPKTERAITAERAAWTARDRRDF